MVEMGGTLHDIGKPKTKYVKEKGWSFHGHEYVGSKMVFKIFTSSFL